MVLPCPRARLTPRPKYAPNTWTKIEPPESLACSNKNQTDMRKKNMHGA
jgi:hypothetical protein